MPVSRRAKQWGRLALGLVVALAAGGSPAAAVAQSAQTTTAVAAGSTVATTASALMLPRPASSGATATTLPPGPGFKPPGLPWIVYNDDHIDVTGFMRGTSHKPGFGDARLELWVASRTAKGGWWLEKSLPMDAFAAPGGLQLKIRLASLPRGRWRARTVHWRDAGGTFTASGWTYTRSVPRNIVALTFDDGPSPGNTDDVVAALARNGDVRATFFMLGGMAESHPSTAKTVLAYHHQLGNHSQDHAALGGASAATIRWEIETAQSWIGWATGVRPTWFRPPYGSTSSTVRAVTADEGLKHVTWDVDPQDWRGAGAATTASRVLSAVRPRAIVLMHDGPARRIGTASAVDRIVPALRDRGYDFVTLDELAYLQR